MKVQSQFQSQVQSAVKKDDTKLSDNNTVIFIMYIINNYEFLGSYYFFFFMVHGLMFHDYLLEIQLQFALPYWLSFF